MRRGALPVSLIKGRQNLCVKSPADAAARQPSHIAQCLAAQARQNRLMPADICQLFQGKAIQQTRQGACKTI